MNDPFSSGRDDEVEISSLRPEGTSTRGHQAQQPGVSVDLAHLLLTRRQRAGRLAITLGAITLGLIVILTTTLLPLAQQSDTPKDPNAAVFLQAEGKFCARDSAWSPDSRRLAIVGTHGNTCNVVSKATPGEVAILDARTGKRLTSYHPDAAILEAASHLPVTAGTASRMPQLEYDDVVWSAQGDRLALTFVLGGTRPFQTYDGLAILTLHGGAIHVYLHSTPRIFNQTGYFVWDLATGDSVLQKPWSTEGDYRVDLPPGPAYSWNEADTLVPSALLPSDSFMPSRIGNPIGDATFSVWQRGVLVALKPAQRSDINEPPVYVFTATFNAWSPDGRYFIEAAHLAGRVENSEQIPPSTVSVAMLQLDHNPILPLRDQCLQTAIDHLPAATIPPYAIGSTIAWSPNGRVAALSLPTGIGIFNCQSGKLLRSYFNEAPHDVYTPVQGFLWSPDGKWLLIQPMNAVVSADALT
jgi:hypothetical protein